MRPDELIHDWNLPDGPGASPPAGPFLLVDETLRDGLQSPSVVDPPIEAKRRLLHLMDALGIDSANLGLPGAGPRAARDAEALLREVAASRLALRPGCGGRTVVSDVEAILRVADRAGTSVEVCMFIGASPIRLYTEDWNAEFVLRQAVEAIRVAVASGHPVMFVTEDTTRTRPEMIRRLFGEAARLGVRRVCVSDTVGHATPEGAARLVRFVRDVLDEAGGAEVGIDWHGHRDRGLGLANALAAYAAGATRVHGTALGMGERSGNVEIDLLLVNLRLLGWIDRDLSRLGEYCRTASEALGVPIASNYPVVGRDAFETATGVHAAALAKAWRKGDAWLADRVYSAVVAGDFGFRQRIRIGPMSGRSNVVFWLAERGLEATPDRVERILEAAKRSDRVLEESEVLGLVESDRAR